jgi:hypothetical protein
LQVAADVFQGYQFGEGAGFRGFDLAGIFAQLWGNPFEFELGVDLFFGLAGNVAGAL